MDVHPPGADIDLLPGLAPRDLLDLFPDGIIVTDSRGAPVYLNPVARQLLMSDSGTDVFDEIVSGSTRRALLGQRIEQIELLIRNVDGQEVWVSVNARALKNNAGRITGSVVLLRDVSRRKRLESEQSRRLERMARTIAAAGMGVWEWDAETNEIWEDTTARQMLGHSRQRSTGTLDHFLAHVHPDDQERIKGAAQHCLADGKMRRIDFRCSPAKGEVRWLVGRFQVVPGPGEIHVRIAGTVGDITESKRLEAALKESEWRFRNAMEHAPIGMAIVDLQGRWLDVNQAVCKMLGYSKTALKRLRFQDITHADDLEADLAYVNQLLSGQIASYQMEKRYVHKSGRIVHAILGVSLLRSENGDPLYFISQIQDVTERRMTEDALRQSEERLRTITDNLPAIIGYADAQEQLRFVNKTYQKWFDIPAKAIQGRPLREILSEEEYRVTHPYIRKALSGQVSTFERTMRGLREVQATYLPRVAKDGTVKGFYILINDITERKRMEAQLREMAQYDMLTGLPNRRLLYDRLGQAIGRVHRHHGHLALLFMDLNKFKKINDTYGHDVGDQVLIQFAGRVKECLRQVDTVARLAGDEFVVIIEDMATPEAAAAVADKIITAMQLPMLIGPLAIQAAPSIGIAVYDGKESADMLVKRADTAMYQIKARGKNS